MIDALMEGGIPADCVGSSKWRCSSYGDGRGGHIFMHFIRAGDPGKVRPVECPVCENPEVDAHEG